MTFFKAYKADLAMPTYFIESTAPNNVDDTEQQSIEEELKAIKDPDLVPLLGDTRLKNIDSDRAVEEIAGILARGKNPNLVVMVHGFNNPELSVLKTYAGAASAVFQDDAISKCDGLVCVGYRWPSESMRAPFSSSWSAMPALPIWVLARAAAIVVLSLLLFCLSALVSIGPLKDHLTPTASLVISVLAHVFFVVGWILIGLIAMAVLLRVIVYFRDNYRATNYGVPDLVQVIRAIEGRVRKLRGKEPANDIELSFIGHSMGGLVVTNAIRTLSDVFATPVDTLNEYGAAAPRHSEKTKEDLQKIGKAFVLKRFVLASPDIPAETLLSDRGNFLASVLSRFEEAYLFCNEGDEVLRLISTVANYFVFPTKSSNHGFRLGSTEILSREYGIIPCREEDFLGKLRTGNLTLRQLYDNLDQAETSRHKPTTAARKPTQLPKVFTYFDCTDYVDEDNRGQKRSLLTFATCNKRGNPEARLPFSAHLRLLWAYLHGRPNVHGGYFEGKLSQQLIYRLACLGYSGAVTAFSKEGGLGHVCKQKQIRVLLSPSLERSGRGPAIFRL